MKRNLFEFAKYYLATVTRHAAIARYKIEEIMQREELYVNFLKLQGEKPCVKDCEHFKTLSPKRMKGVNDLLISGCSLAHIKTYTIWKGK